MIEVDAEVGSILKKIDDLGIADNTIVVDNGADTFSSWPDGGNYSAAPAAPWSLDAQSSILLLLRRGGRLLFAAGCTDPGASNIPGRERLIRLECRPLDSRHQIPSSIGKRTEISQQ
jgi:hypothetical protein